MALRTAEEYRAGLRDQRTVYYKGERVDVTTEPDFIQAIDHSALCYEIQEQEPELAVANVDGEPTSFFWFAPRSREDLARRRQLIEAVSRRGGGTIVLKEVGSDALFALLRATTGDGQRNAQAFAKQVRQHDLALCVGQTDVKGDRSKKPSEQNDPDHYLHIVDEDETSITVCGAKTHTSFSANADEIVVLPTRAMSEDDASFAVSFAIPIDTPGLSLYVSPYSAGETSDFEHPLSSRHKLLESLTVFDNVRVPKERVFLNKQPELAGPLALAFVDFHRFTAVNYKLPLLDQIVGAAILMAEANGTTRAAHVRSKITHLITWAETVRGLAELAVHNAAPSENGVWRPDPLAVNMAKYHFANGFNQATAHLIDISGGMLITGPGGRDWANPDIRDVLEKYYAAAVPGERRLRLANLISDLTAHSYGGYQRVLALHAEGSLEAEKLEIYRSYDSDRATSYVSELAGLQL